MKKSEARGELKINNIKMAEMYFDEEGIVQVDLKVSTLSENDLFSIQETIDELKRTWEGD